MTFEWIPVDSERITHYGYDSEAGTIYVMFTDGLQWHYASCGPEVWEEFQFAPSKGRYIREVLDHHPHGPA